MIAPARALAFDILMQVGWKGAHSDELLRSRKIDTLNVQDCGLVTTLVLGTLRWQMSLDSRLRPLLSRPDGRLPAPVQTALRLGAFQLLYLDRIPAYAAIGESVELAKQAGETHAARMVNAVLRKLSNLPLTSENSYPKSAREIAEATAHPVWMVDRWARIYSPQAAEAICRFNQEPTPITVRLLDPAAEEDLAAEGILLEPSEFLTAARRVVSGDIIRSETFRRGRLRIQDEGSQLVAELAGTGMKILDTCAAPGGKTAILAERNPETTITAWDISKRRLDAMRATLAPIGDRIKFEVHDAAEAKLKPEYDLILCDVPCTGTGTIARNPEIRFRIDEQEITRQHARQVKILLAALVGLTPGGRLLYSTCSLEPEENEAVIAPALKANREFTALSIDAEIARLASRGILTSQDATRLNTSAIKDGFLRTIPGIHHCDGFFAALLTRN